MTNSDFEILFHTESISFSLVNEEAIRLWILDTISNEDKANGNLNFIFCNDEYLHKINLEHLNHDTYTDIITFQLRYDRIEGDIFISIDRVKENAELFKVSFDKELMRVIIHGVLHLIGYKDKSPDEVQLMRQKEDFYLSRCSNSFSPNQ